MQLSQDFVASDKILGYHYDTFGYIKIDHKQAIQRFFDKGKDLMLLGNRREHRIVIFLKLFPAIITIFSTSFKIGRY
jgi:hypothetical protein